MAIFSPSSTFSSGRSEAFIPGGYPTNPAPQAASPTSLFSMPANGVDYNAQFQAAIAAMNSTPSAAGALQGYQEDPRFTAMLAAQMARGQQTDADISTQAGSIYDAQRAAAEPGLNRQVTRAQAANGVLPTGGLATQYYNEISEPILAGLQSQRSQNELSMRNTRDGVNAGVTSTLAGVDSNKNQFTLAQITAQRQAEMQRQQLSAQSAYQQASLGQQSQLASQQLAAEQARAQQQSSLAQQQLNYERERDSNSLNFQRESLAAQNQRFYSGGSGGSGSGGGSGGGAGAGGGSLNGGLNYGEGMRENYNNMNAAENLRGGRDAQGNYINPPASQQPTVSSSSTPRPYSGSGMNTSNGSGGGGASGGAQSIYQGSSATGTMAGGSGWSMPSQTAFYNPPASGSNFTPTYSMFS